MTITFRTVVLDMAPTPLGLLPRRFLIEHWCNECGDKIGHDALADHARTHGARPARQEGGLIE
jgi:hypothetical protein